MLTRATGQTGQNQDSSDTDLVVVDVAVPGDDDALLDPRLRQATFQRLWIKNQGSHGGCMAGPTGSARLRVCTLVMCVVVVVHRDSDVIVWAVIKTPGSPSPLPSN